MANLTPNLGLFKYDPSTDLNEQFSFEQALNDNWDILDEFSKNLPSGRNIGEIVSSTIPLMDAGLHLLDGALIQGGGMYSDFVDYIKEIYSDLTFVGSVSETNGVLSDFSNTSCVKLQKNIPSSTNIEFIVKVKPTNFSRNHNVIFRPFQANAPFGFSSAGKPELFTGSWSGGVTTYTSNQTVWLRLVWNGSSNKLYSQLDNNYTLDNLPNNWTTEVTWTTSTNVLSGSGFNLGQNDTATQEYFVGSIDLNGCQIKVNNSIWWSGKIPAYFTDETSWQTAVTTYGVCGKFVYDSVNNTVRLPKVTGIIEGTTDITALGDLVEAGLPDINGNFGTDVWPQPYQQTGAFSRSEYAGTYRATNTGYASDVMGLMNFNASDSSSIYGNSSTVQPQTVKILYYIVIATSTKTEIQSDIDEIATDLNGKADVDLSNVPTSKGILSESYINGTSWYRVYSDGWCEQGGKYSFTGTHGATYSINLVKSFSNTDYTVLRGGTFSINTDALVGLSVVSKATDSFSIQYASQNGASYAVDYYWQASGYIN